MEILSSFIPLLVFYAIGFLFGYSVNKERVTDVVEETKRHINKLHKNDLPVGVIRRPTPEQLAKRTDPYEKKIEEGKDAMRKTLENIKELK